MVLKLSQFLVEDFCQLIHYDIHVFSHVTTLLVLKIVTFLYCFNILFLRGTLQSQYSISLPISTNLSIYQILQITK